MLTGIHNRTRLLVAVVLAGIGATCSAQATTITYDLYGYVPGVQTTTSYGGSYGYYTVTNTLYLGNTDTGGDTVPAITLNTGDTINGIVSLSNPWTLPATRGGGGASISLFLQNAQGTDTLAVGLNDSVSFFYHGAPVSVPSGFDLNGGSAGGPLLDISTIDTDATPAFTFDQIDFSGTMTFALDDSFQDVNTASLNSSYPVLSVMYYPLQTAPSPATAWLMLPGLLGIWAMTRRRKAAQAA